jgi:cell volume regulation protein A
MGQEDSRLAAIDSLGIAILLGAVLVLAGIMSSLLALRFGTPLLLVFLLVGMLAGEAGPGGIHFDNVAATYLVGSVALALILFDGGLRTRFASFRNVLAPAGALATLGVFLTALITAPVAAIALNLGWVESLLVGAVVASTDAAAVFFLMHARGLRLRPRVSATLEVESGTNDPFAVFLTIVLIEILLGGSKPAGEIAWLLAREAVLGALFGWLGGRAIVYVLDNLNLPEGLRAPFVASAAMVTFALSETLQGSGFLAAYLAGLTVGNVGKRTYGNVIVFLDAATWLGQIAMFVLLGLLAWPQRLPELLLPSLAVALTLMLVARPAAVFLCLWPFRFSLRERLFVSWVGLRGAVGIFLASIPLLVGLPQAHVYFDVGFVVVLASLLVQGWTIALAARRLGLAKRRPEIFRPRVELDLPGQRAQELVGYQVVAGSPYLRRGITPPWAKLTLVARGDNVLTPEEAQGLREGDHVYFLSPPEKAAALDRFFADLPPPTSPDPQLLGDFFVEGDAKIGALSELYGIPIAVAQHETAISDFIRKWLGREPQPGDTVEIGGVALVVHKTKDGRVLTVGLQLAEPGPETLRQHLTRLIRDIRRDIGTRLRR